MLHETLAQYLARVEQAILRLNEESLFVRHAYFLGANDPYKLLKTASRPEINEDA